MITDQAYTIQEEKKEIQELKEGKIDWEEKVKREFPYDWPEFLAAIQTAESIIGAEALNRGINWEKIYQACQVPIDAIFSSFYDNQEVERINQCYQQFIRGEVSALKSIYYFSNYGLDHLSLGQLLTRLKNADCMLTSLNLGENYLDAEGAETIADVLENKHCQLTLLDFKLNYIGDKGAKAIAIALKSEYCKLTSLSLEENYIGDNGAKAFADALKSEHCGLTSLKLGWNYIGDAGAKEIANALKSEQCKLKSLDLWGNQIGETGKLAIALALKHPYCFRNLHIDLDSDVQNYILKFNEEWSQAQALYTLLAHPDGSSQHLAILPPYVAIKSLFPYLFDIFKDEPQSQVGDCFFENHKNHFEMMRAQKQKPHEVKCGCQEAEKQTVYKCN